MGLLFFGVVREFHNGGATNDTLLSFAVDGQAVTGWCIDFAHFDDAAVSAADGSYTYFSDSPPCVWFNVHRHHFLTTRNGLCNDVGIHKSIPYGLLRRKEVKSAADFHT